MALRQVRRREVYVHYLSHCSFDQLLETWPRFFFNHELTNGPQADATLVLSAGLLAMMGALKPPEAHCSIMTIRQPTHQDRSPGRESAANLSRYPPR